MEGQYPYYYPPGSFPVHFRYYNHPQVRPDLQLPGPSGVLAVGDPASRSISPTTTSSNSPSGSTDGTVNDALDVEAEDAAQSNRKQYDKWTNEEQKALINLWTDRHERLESKDARKIWEEIAREINRRFGTTRSGEKCQKKMKYLIERYKKAKDWNSHQTGGHRWKTVFYDEIDAVLGCRDVVTLRNVAEAGASASTSAAKSDATESKDNELLGQDTSPEARTERKKKRKRARPQEGDEEGDLIKASLVGMEKQRKEMNTMMESSTGMQEQQANTMNVLVGALTNFLQNSGNNNK